MQMKASVLQYLKEKQFIDDEEFELYFASAVGKRPSTPKLDKPSEKLSVKSLWSWSEVELKQLIPKAKGCTIQEVVRADGTKSLSGRYPGEKPKVSRSRTFHDAARSQAAAKHVFLWLWKQHGFATGEKLPYDIQDADGP